LQSPAFALTASRACRDELRSFAIGS
jgi:hypothetical protein